MEILGILKVTEDDRQLLSRLSDMCLKAYGNAALADAIKLTAMLARVEEVTAHEPVGLEDVEKQE